MGALYYNGTGIDNDNLFLPIQFGLCNYPNPFNAQTTIDFLLPENSPVTLEIFDLSGCKIETVIGNKQLNSGLKQTIAGNGNFILCQWL